MNRQISRVALASLVLLAALILATTYWQTWASGGLAARQDNDIQRVAQFKIKRGLIYAADGKTVLAANVRRKAGGQTLYFRVYPTGGFASQVVGYSTQSRSRAGLERSENAYLTSSNKDLGTVFDTLGDKLKGTTITGNDLVLTIKPRVQKVAESLLQGKCGAAVVLNPKTGAVYAMASSPGFDPNLIEKPGGYAKIQHTSAPCSPSAPLLNRATQGLYPPGSTFKVVTAAAALDAGVYGPESTFYDPGYCTEYGKPVYNAGNPDQNGPEAYGNVTLVQAFEHSINAVFCNIGKRLGAGRVLEQARRFGFYSLPPLETPADARSASGLYRGSRLYSPKHPDPDVDPGRLAFGQERMLATPLQMAMVAAAVANNGVIIEPHVLKEVRAPNGSIVMRTHRHRFSRAMKPKTAQTLRDMMVDVVRSGTGTAAQIPGVTVAGKTGTAETGREHVYTAWFLFFAPAEDPVVAGAVVLEGQLNGFGGTVAAPIARSIMQATLPETSKGTP
jgi:peptidoglycan glycosyltransferase